MSAAVCKGILVIPERSVRAGAYIGGDGLPRPIRGPAPKDPSRKAHRRRFALERLGLDVQSLPPMLQQLVLEHQGSLEPMRRQLLAQACLSRGLDVGRLGLVLNLVGDAPIGDEQLLAIAETYRRSKLPTQNFEVERFTRWRTTVAKHAMFALYVRVDGRDGVHRVSLRAGDLASQVRFTARCIEFADFMPLFRDLGPRTYAEFVAQLLRTLQEDADA